MENKNVTFLADLLDDLTHEDMCYLLNWLSLDEQVVSRANIKRWRRLNNKPVD
jgi:hypothetical protein